MKTSHVKQFRFPYAAGEAYRSLYEPLLSQRGFLQLHPSTHGIIRSSNEFLVSNESRGLTIVDTCWLDEVSRKMSTGVTGFYRAGEKYRDNLSDKGKKAFNRKKPKISYAIINGKMQQITLNPLVDTVEIDDKTYEGQITDFQISGNLLYIVNQKGFFSIFRFYSLLKFGHFGTFRLRCPQAMLSLCENRCVFSVSLFFQSKSQKIPLCRAASGDKLHATLV